MRVARGVVPSLRARDLGGVLRGVRLPGILCRASPTPVAARFREPGIVP